MKFDELTTFDILDEIVDMIFLVFPLFCRWTANDGVVKGYLKGTHIALASERLGDKIRNKFDSSVLPQKVLSEATKAFLSFWKERP